MDSSSEAWARTEAVSGVQLTLTLAQGVLSLSVVCGVVEGSQLRANAIPRNWLTARGFAWTSTIERTHRTQHLLQPRSLSAGAPLHHASSRPLSQAHHSPLLYRALVWVDDVVRARYSAIRCLTVPGGSAIRNAARRNARVT